MINQLTQLFTGGDDPKKKIDPLEKELRDSYKNVIRYDNRPAIDVVRTAAQKSGVDPSLLYSSSFQEGFNKSILSPDEVSEAYLNAEGAGLDTNSYPVDGFFNYGLDTFGTNYDRLKKYLPEGFDKRFKTFDAFNEKNEKVKTAAFMTNEDALMAKGAMLRDIADQVDYYANKKGVKIRPEDRDYFILSSYNGGWGNGKKMIDEYAADTDQSTYVSKGRTKRQGVHKNVAPRLAKKKIVEELLQSYLAEQASQQQNVQQ